MFSPRASQLYPKRKHRHYDNEFSDEGEDSDSSSLTSSSDSSFTPSPPIVIVAGDMLPGDHALSFISHLAGYELSEVTHLLYMFFLGKVTALGVLCCFALIVVCLTLLASFFLPSHLSLKHVMYVYKLSSMFTGTQYICSHNVKLACWGCCDWDICILTLLSSMHTYIHGSFFLWKSDCLGCAVLLCFVVCLTLLASFFLPSASPTNMCIHANPQNLFTGPPHCALYLPPMPRLPGYSPAPLPRPPSTLYLHTLHQPRALHVLSAAHAGPETGH